MTRNPQLRRILVALLISVAIHSVVLSIGPLAEHHPVSAITSLLDLFDKPSATFVKWVVPAGHDAVHIVGALTVSLVSSVVFYGILTWVMLTAWAQRRTRRNGDKTLSVSP
jgi:hypothetical protein